MKYNAYIKYGHIQFDFEDGQWVRASWFHNDGEKWDITGETSEYECGFTVHDTEPDFEVTFKIKGLSYSEKKELAQKFKELILTIRPTRSAYDAYYGY